MSSATPPDGPAWADVALRPATLHDAPAVAEVYLASRAAAAMPPSIHSDDEVAAWLAARLDADEVWVAESELVVVAYLRLTDTWLDDLYVLPDRMGQGIGSALLDLAKARRPGGFGLWVFEMNLAARAFYRSHGLVEVTRTDGADNEEKMPDLHLAWVP